jgi:hypothetical protein
MGCFGGSKNDFFGGSGIIVILIILFLFCSGGSDIFSDLFEHCDILVVIAIILLVLSLCNGSNCHDD